MRITSVAGILFTVTGIFVITVMGDITHGLLCFITGALYEIVAQLRIANEKGR